MLPGHHHVAIAVGVVLCASACRSPKSPEKDEAEAASVLPATPWKAAAIAHGGVGSPPDKADGARAAVDAALAALEAGADPVDAAVAGVVVLEDDARFNAGTGSRVRIDGATVQMDAAVMRSDGTFGAVSVIEYVKNPVKVARAVIDTPHILLAGDGATMFARSLGMEEYDPATDEMKAKTAEIIERLKIGADDLPKRWKKFPWKDRWNFERTLAEAGLTEEDIGTDTVAVAVRTTDGRFAAAISTGGTAITLRGRVGDVPILGAGVYTGSHGAVAATGTGERIVEAAASRTVYQRLETGTSVDEAAAQIVSQLDPKGSIGIILIGPTSMSAAADRPMAWAGREQGSDTWFGPGDEAVSK
jgi:isoaspartyl peptidase/L-asparaginase-like protein (Ntn-hydrolase superfamily)